MRNSIHKFIPRDFWHGERRVGQHFNPGKPGGYYNDLTWKTQDQDYKGPKSKLGIPLVNVGGNYLLHPVTVCQVALGYYEKWLAEKLDRDLERFIDLANWLVVQQENRKNIGAVWPIPYGVELYKLTTGWISSLVQGQAISVLVRAYHETNKNIFLEVSERALGPFQIEVANGGLCRFDERGNIFFEEYPANKPIRVLNGFISSLWGLYDYAVYVQDSSIRDLFNSGVNSLIGSLQLYDAGFWSRYSLFEHEWFSNLASFYYHIEHITQLQAMHSLTRNENLLNYANKWETYSLSYINIIRVLGIKSYSRVRNRIRST